MVENLDLKHRQVLKRKCDLISKLGEILASSGAETRLILSSMDLLAKALNLSVQSAVNRAGVFVSFDTPEGQVLSFRRIKTFGINMTIVTYCHQLCLKAERGEFKSLDEISEALNHLPHKHYPKIFLVPIEAIAAGCFAYLNQANLEVIASAILGALILMSIRFYLSQKGFFETFIFMVSSFVGSFCALLFAKAQGVGLEGQTLAILATSLVLVPGFPLINGFLDLFKGYIDTGITRLMQALVLVSSAAIGILGALLIANYYGV